MSPTPRLSSRTVAVPLTTALAATFLAGCSTEPEYVAVCADPQTMQRLGDDACPGDDDPDDYDGTTAGPHWFYLSTGSRYRIPGVGSRIDPTQGTWAGRSLVSGGRAVQRGGLPAKGGSSLSEFTKSGGFGSSKGVSRA